MGQFSSLTTLNMKVAFVAALGFLVIAALLQDVEGLNWIHCGLSCGMGRYKAMYLPGCCQYRYKKFCHPKCGMRSIQDCPPLEDRKKTLCPTPFMGPKM